MVDFVMPIDYSCTYPRLLFESSSLNCKHMYSYYDDVYVNFFMWPFPVLKTRFFGYFTILWRDPFAFSFSPYSKTRISYPQFP